MSQGVILDGDDVVDVGVEEKSRPAPPPADPKLAPKGWRYDRVQKEWVPRVRAPKLSEQGARGSADGGAAEDGDASDSDRPDSAWATGPDGKALHARPGVLELTEELSTDIEAVLELLFLPVVLTAERKDPICGAAFVENWDKIRTRSIPLIARSPALVEWLTKAGGAKDWVMFAAALKPVGVAVWQHHVAHTITIDEESSLVVEENFDRYAA